MLSFIIYRFVIGTFIGPLGCNSAKVNGTAVSVGKYRSYVLHSPQGVITAEPSKLRGADGQLFKIFIEKARRALSANPSSVYLSHDHLNSIRYTSTIHTIIRCSEFLAYKAYEPLRFRLRPITYR